MTAQRTAFFRDDKTTADMAQAAVGKSLNRSTSVDEAVLKSVCSAKELVSEIRTILEDSPPTQYKSARDLVNEDVKKTLPSKEELARTLKGIRTNYFNDPAKKMAAYERSNSSIVNTPTGPTTAMDNIQKQHPLLSFSGEGIDRSTGETIHKIKLVTVKRLIVSLIAVRDVAEGDGHSGKSSEVGSDGELLEPMEGDNDDD